MASTGTLPERSTTLRGYGPAAALALAVAGGTVSGAITSFAQGLPFPFAGFANAVSPWLVVPFVVGATPRRRRWALVVGVVACAGQVAGYYATAHLRGFPVGTGGVLLWLACALPGGLAAGAAGWSWWRSVDAPGPSRWAARERGLGGAVLVAAWLAEALVTYTVVLRYTGHAVAFVAAGAVTFVLLGRHGRQHGAIARWLVPTTALACAGFAVLHSL
ncbi:hypothetical protein H9657_15475 [Cellulomonas sp. Sa3CUA2]|uniref:Integral membrane protein n=1 Tax=Cellulomonas avistercoris TaxID=2762242 RepID=A0ABR8QGW0_9CELL|nr:DUF6518 family protein [Cellulomonas avistercoris]MBD7919670.1 hypothetical protein [Cellulomonas avistercoris]